MRKKDIHNNNRIRIILLESGLAELENLDIAIRDEIEAQDNAIKSQNGVWKGNNDNNITIHNISTGMKQYRLVYMKDLL